MGTCLGDIALLVHECYYNLYETGSRCEAQAGLELMAILTPRHPEYCAIMPQFPLTIITRGGKTQKTTNIDEYPAYEILNNLCREKTQSKGEGGGRGRGREKWRDRRERNNGG